MGLLIVNNGNIRTKSKKLFVFLSIKTNKIVI